MNKSSESKNIRTLAGATLESLTQKCLFDRVAVGDIGLIGSRKDIPPIRANRTKLRKILRRRGIVVELWPSA